MPKYPASHDSSESDALLSTPELNRAVWDRAAARLLAKMLGQFAYEEVIEPEAIEREATEPLGQADGGDTYTLTLDDGGTLSFSARRGVYGGWHIAPESILETSGGVLEAQAGAAGTSDGDAPHGTAA